jgi:hypothetical protein
LSKYLSRKTTVNGVVFDSKKEARRYYELLLQQKAGMISGLERQKKFVLIPTQREPDMIGARGGKHPGKVIEKECAYIADFVYQVQGQTVVEDVKGYRMGGAYTVFTIKRKLMLERYGIRVLEI